MDIGSQRDEKLKTGKGRHGKYKNRIPNGNWSSLNKNLENLYSNVALYGVLLSFAIYSCNSKLTDKVGQLSFIYHQIMYDSQMAIIYKCI